MLTIKTLDTTFCLSLASTLIFVAQTAQADIYKWRDKSGVTQYSDSLPADAGAKNLHQETIKLLQAAQSNDFCSDVPTNKTAKPSISANFFGVGNIGLVSANNGANNGFGGIGFGAALGQKPAVNQARPIAISPINSAKPGATNASSNFFGQPTNNRPVANQYSPFGSSGFLNVGGRAITVFGRPINTAQTVKPKPKPTPTPTPTPTPSPSPTPTPTPTPATGNVFYIAINGDNNNPGTEALPWRNLNHAVYALKAGETVLVKNGTYQESLYINKSGIAGKPISYKAFPGHTPKIEINRKELEGILIQGASYINIEGFEVAYTAPGAEAAKGEQTDNGIDISNAGQVLPHHINIKNNNVHGFPGGGIFTVLADYVTFEGNTVWENALWAKWGNSGISMYQNVNFDQAAGYHMIIRGNTIYKNENKLPSFAIGSTTITDGNCIIIDDTRLTQKFLDNKTPYPVYKSNTLIENNICYDNGARGIHVYSSDNVLVRHNTLYKNQRTNSINDGELTAFDASNVRFVNNIVYTAPGKKANGSYNASNVVFERNLYFGAAEIPNKSATDIVADPLFTNPSINPTTANFSLKVGSPAVDAALAGQSPSIDITGKARPLGVVADIGAYESR
jgi:parallel beta-helix repeat protein